MNSVPVVEARPAVASDEPFLRELFYTVRAPEFAPANLPEPALRQLLDQQYEAMRTHYAREYPETEYTILRVNGVDVGYEALRVTTIHHLIDIALIAEYRNRGIGTDRIREIQRRATAAGHALLLTVEIFNPARRLYERLGFRVTDEVGVYRRMTWTPDVG